MTTLAETLHTLEQGNSHQLQELPAQLADKAIMEYPDATIRTLVGVCIVDLFRIFAPEAPLEPQEMEPVFRHLSRELNGLSDVQTHHLFEKRFYILENMCAIKIGFVLLDLEQDGLVCEMFQALISAINATHSPAVEGCMLTLMQETLEESDVFSSSLLRVIFQPLCHDAEFPSQGSAAKQLAKRLLQSLSTQVHCQLQLWLQNLVQTKEWPNDFDNGPSVEQEPIETAHMHQLILELASISHVLVARVLPVLENNMQAADSGTRLEATELLCEISLIPSVAESSGFAYLDVILQRAVDALAEVRCVVVDWLKRYLSQADTIPDERGITVLAERIMDHDENVRIAAIAAVCDVTQCHTAEVSVSILECLASRTTDRKLCVQQEAIQALCTLHEAYHAMSPQNRRKFAAQYTWMPTRVVGSYGSGASPKDVYSNKLFIEQAIEQSLLPQVQVLISSSSEWASFACLAPATISCVHDQRMSAGAQEGRAEAVAMFFHNLDAPARQTYQKLLLEKVKFGQHLHELVSARQSCNKEAVSQAMGKISKAIPDTVPNKAQLLSYLSSIKDKPALRLLRNMCETAETIEQVHQTKKAVLQQSTVAQSSKAVQSFFARAAATSFSLIDFRQLFDIWHSEASLKLASEQLIAIVSTVAPHLCVALLPEIAKQLSEHCDSVPQTALCVIGACAGDALQHAELQQPQLGQQLVAWCTTSISNPEGATRAAYVICHARLDKKELLAQIMEEANLLDASDALPCLLATFNEIAGSAPAFLISAWPKVFSFLMKHVVAPKSKPFSAHKCLSLALELISKFACMVPADQIVSISSQAFEQLSPLLAHKSKRLHAIKAILCMAQHPQICPLVSPQLFHQLAQCFENESVGGELVRSGELYKLLASGLHPHFSVLFALCSSFSEEGQKAAKSQLLTYCTNLRAKLQVQSADHVINAGSNITDCHPEAQLPYLVHCLAHRTDFPERSGDEKWEPIQSALQIYLAALLSHTAGNISYIHAVLKAILRTQDGMDNSSCRIHHISYVAMGLLQNQRGATQPVYDHKIQLPCSYYDPSPTAAVRSSSQFQMPNGVFKLPVSPGAKRQSPSKNTSPATKRRRGPKSDDCKQNKHGSPTGFGAHDKVATSNQDKGNPVAGRKKRRESTLNAPDKQHRQTEKQLSDLASHDQSSENSDLDDVSCELCDSRDHAESMLLCDKCDKGFHMDCLNPVVQKMPKGSWFCDQCCLETKDVPKLSIRTKSINIPSTKGTKKSKVKAATSDRHDNRRQSKSKTTPKHVKRKVGKAAVSPFDFPDGI